ncbi:hypothetical protein AOCH_000088 [Aspergillus ochraceoroseus]|uniref:Uncharacterized protein n=1 Tax=Aspergillus ochraceoroseus TaxID=138278 RepID=A0A0F8VQW0_9EURO|nr:hypothetical protein AOCH_000088 [Aspergillus ochraceoroseus]
MADVLISTPSLESGSFMTVTSARQFDKLAVFEAHVLSYLRRVKEYHEFVFTDVPPSWGQAILRLIDEKIASRKSYNTTSRSLSIRVMPTEIQNCIQDWLLNHDVTREEQLLLHGIVGTTLEFKYGPYTGSTKEPDFFFRVNGHILPTLAVECGWSESGAPLLDGMNMLLVGGDGSIKVVIIVEWTRLQGGRVSGTVELFMRDRNGMPRLVQSETVFPPPATASSQRLGIRRCDLFGPAMLAGRDGNDVLYLDIEQLRDHAARNLGFMNLVPA